MESAKILSCEQRALNLNIEEKSIGALIDLALELKALNTS
jgi:hypothetical protein